MLPILTLSIFPACLVAAALSDILTLKIPNWVSFTLIIAFWPAALLAGLPVSAQLWALAAAGGVLLVGFALFAGNFLGAGDAKLLTACALWMGLTHLVPFVLYVGVAGAFVACAVIVVRVFPLTPLVARTNWLMNLRGPQARIPYAVAIAAAGLLVFPQTHVFLAAAA